MSDYKSHFYDNARPADLTEREAIRVINEGYEPDWIVVYPNYISDGPGYRGWLAVAVGGEPHYCATYIKTGGNIELCCPWRDLEPDGTSPFNDTWEDWSRAVIDEMIDQLECSNGDAQGVYEAQEKLAVQIWHKDYTPKQAATAICHASESG